MTERKSQAKPREQRRNLNIEEMSSLEYTEEQMRNDEYGWPYPEDTTNADATERAYLLPSGRYLFDRQLRRKPMF